MSDIVTAVAFVLAGIVISYAVCRLFRWLEKKADKTESKIDDILVLSLGKPIIIGILVTSVFTALGYVTLPSSAGWILQGKYFNTIIIILATWIFSTFAQNFIKLYGRWISEQTENSMDDKIVDVLEVSVKYIIWFVAFLLILSYLNIDITPLIAAGGVAGIAIALAAQDLVSNFFGGALIVMDKPFKIGDRIKIDGNLGDVVSIGPRSTRIQTLDYQLLTIPNSKIANTIVTNYAMPDVKLKVKIPVSVAYGSDVKRVKEVLYEIAGDAAKKSDYILNNPKPGVYFLEFGASSLDFMMVLWAKRFNMSWEIKDQVNLEIDRRFAEEGIEIPFPQMDVHMRD
ncbi:small-conductance mechanosensitive channel [Methanomicrobium sp. W14]|uniref:mechanosensitive ion channel family protein n=1 Tax=Methanomicrobium sp. W14 TaxID=2817839 RepID=UPI001AE93110|nr:mechanosensitive ion channel family protein [Methanomicrobium sp. W14]MBP2134368.1 small-conductance mechanosensitive channel [Methanomicrobium sp. W14]